MKATPGSAMARGTKFHGPGGNATIAVCAPGAVRASV